MFIECYRVSVNDLSKKDDELKKDENIILVPIDRIEFIQTSSIGHLFIIGSVVTLNSRHSLFSSSEQFSAISCKKVGTDEWDLIGDLG